MDYPENLTTALEVEQVVRENGGVPATIAIMGGKLRVGLSKEEIQDLAQNAHKSKKCSRRDISMILAGNGYGSTTVAGTMIIADMAGIRVFATGGVGGVHRGVEKTMDISADLTELARTPVAVVCAGIKSILDIPRTLEYLETMGVNVFGYKTNEFPAFYNSKSGCKANSMLESDEQAGRILDFHFNKLALKSGLLIGNPIPVEQEVACEMINDAIQQALLEADEKNIIGAETTPFLLRRIVEITGGESLAANIALIKSNAKVATLIATAYLVSSSNN